MLLPWNSLSTGALLHFSYLVYDFVIGSNNKDIFLSVFFAHCIIHKFHLYAIEINVDVVI